MAASKTIRIAHNAVIAKLLDAPQDAQLEVQRVLSYRVAGAEHMAAFKSHSWDGRSNFFDYGTSTFPRGFLQYVQSALSKLGYRVSPVRHPFPKPLGPELPQVDAFGYAGRYDYQPEVMHRLLRHGQMIAQIATGGGKSRIAQICTARINRPTLFLTTRGVLMHQMAEKFTAMGKQVAILGDGSLQVSTEVTCGMVQTIASWLDEPKAAESVDPEAFRKQTARRKKMIEVLARFEFVILEEAHEVSSESFYEIMQHCRNAHYRLALTATPFMKDDEEANMRLMAVSGSIAIHITEEMLIERGILARPYFKYVPLPEKPPKLFRSSPWQRAYELGITGHELRNRLAVVEAMRARSYGLSVMMLVQRKEHGRALCDIMTRNGIRARFIHGEADQSSRKKALTDLAGGAIDVLLGTTILDVGVDVPAVGMIILVGGGKAEVALRQRIGRGLREKKVGPNVAFVVDFADGHNEHLLKHYLQRRAVVEATPGFNENIVRDFDFVGLGFAKGFSRAAQAIPLALLSSRE